MVVTVKGEAMALSDVKRKAHATCADVIHKAADEQERKDVAAQMRLLADQHQHKADWGGTV